MAQVQQNEQPQVNLKGSTFAEVIKNQRTPVNNGLHELLNKATGDLFKLISGSNEMIKTKDGSEEVRAVYKVQPLNSELLPLSTELEVKIKGTKCFLSEKDNMDLMFNSRMIIVAFDDMSHWVFNGTEGLNATKVRVLQLSKEQIMKIVGGTHRA